MSPIPCLLLLVLGGGATADSAPPADYLARVVAYADAMIAQGSDVYGRAHSPLFAEALDRSTMRMLEGAALEQVARISFKEWGIRSHDRMLGGANPQHCQDLYRILYALSAVTGQSRYAEEADRSLRYFFTHCQSPATGLFYWGEHAGWDLRNDGPLEKPSGDTHEFYRPWMLWDRSWTLAPDACRRFALGLWEHQIGNQRTGDYSRHAKISVHGPGTESPYARHGGFYIETWAAAYEKTGEKVFLRAIESVLDGLERARLHEGGYLTSRDKKTGNRRPYDLSLAVSLEDAAAKVPEALAAQMRQVASVNDDAFDESRAAASPKPGAEQGNLWSNAYGGGARVGFGNTLMHRYRQTRRNGYRDGILAEAEKYRDQQVDLRSAVWPGTVGDAVLLMLNAHELTADARDLDAADRFARQAVTLFLDDACPLPKASHLHDHYEAVTNADTLMMAMLKLWLRQNKPAMKIDVIDYDR